MKIVIVSDIHGNFDALSHLPEDYDQLWVLGDLVNYGPQPGEVISFVRRHSAHVVRGNHDHCIGYGESPRCSSRLEAMALATRKYTDAVLGDDDRDYLRNLPLQMDVRIGKTRHRLCHALPSEPLFAHHQYRSELWQQECQRTHVDVLFVAHGHTPFAIQLGSTLVVNPGSLGQPRSGEPLASYAVLRDWKLSLRSFQYPLNLTAEKIRALPICAVARAELIATLRTGSVPSERGRDVTVGSIYR